MTFRLRTAGRTVISAALAVVLWGTASSRAQTTAEEFRAAFASGDRTACMEAGNAASDFKELAKELAAPLFEVVAEGGPCAGNALSALTNLGPGIVEGVDVETALPILMATLEKGIDVENGPPATQAQSALFVLGHLGEAAAPAVPLIERWLVAREEAHEKRYALMVLGEIGNPARSAVPTLLDLMAPAEEDDWERQEVRNAVLRMLGRIPAAAEQTGPALVELLASEDWGLAGLASEALAQLGEPVVPLVMTKLDASDEEVRERAAEVLKEIGPAAAPAAIRLIGLLDDESWNVSYEARSALETIGPSEDVVSALVEVATTGDSEDSRTAAMEVLATFGPAARGALPALRELAASDDWSLRSAAEEAIRMIEATE